MRKKSILSFMITVFVALCLSSITPSATFAAASPKPTPKASPTSKVSPSPEATPPSEETTTQKIKERIDRVFEQRRDQVRGVIDQLGQRKRGFIGEVQRVTDKTITIKTLKGTTQILTITPEIVMVKDDKKTTVDEVAVGDWIIAMGYTDGKEFELKRVVVSSKPLTYDNIQTIIGNVQSITKTELTLTPRAAADQANLKTFKLLKNTRYQDGAGQTIKREQVEKDTQYLVIATLDSDQLNAVLVRSLAEK